MQGLRGLQHLIHRLRFPEKTEVRALHGRQFPIAPRIQAPFTHPMNPAPAQVQHRVACGDTLRCQAHGEGESGAAIRVVGQAGVEPLRPPAGLELREQAVFALATEQVAEKDCRLDPPLVRLGRQFEQQSKFAPISIRGDLHHQGSGFRQQRYRSGSLCRGFPGDGTKALGDHTLQIIQRAGTGHRQRHPIGRVVVVIEIPQGLSHRLSIAVGQRFAVAHGKLRQGMVRVDDFGDHVAAATLVIAQFEPVFGIHGVALTLHILGVEPGRDEELREAIECGLEMSRIDVEEIGRPLEAGIGVVTAAVSTDKGLVGSGFRILLGTQKQHVLEKMGQPGPVSRIVEAACRHAQRGGALVTVRVRNEHQLQAVV